MRKFALASLAASLLTVTICNNVTAQALPQLKRGMPYDKARKMLVSQGWQAVSNPQQVNNATRSRNIDYFIRKKGYVEIVDCSGTGLGLCLFRFKNAKGDILMVSTANNQPPYQNVLYGWTLEKPQKN